MYILDVVPCIVSPCQTKYEGVETCGSESKLKAPGCGMAVSFSERGGGGAAPTPPSPPLLSSPMSNTKKNGRVEGPRGPWIGPMKRTAKHRVQVQSKRGFTKKKHSENGKAAVLSKSLNPKHYDLRSRRTRNMSQERGLQTIQALLLVAAAVPAHIKSTGQDTDKTWPKEGRDNANRAKRQRPISRVC